MTNLSDHRKLDKVLEHIRRVESCLVLVANNILSTDKELALELVRRGRGHDLSKLELAEFDHLWDGDPHFEQALVGHRLRNAHHPEHWNGGVEEMGEADLAEMACDVAARGQEFGTNVRAWLLHGDGAHRYGIRPGTRAFDTLSKYLDILLPVPFKVRD